MQGKWEERGRMEEGRRGKERDESEVKRRDWLPDLSGPDTCLLTCVKRPQLMGYKGLSASLPCFLAGWLEQSKLIGLFAFPLPRWGRVHAGSSVWRGAGAW